MFVSGRQFCQWNSSCALQGQGAKKFRRWFAIRRKKQRRRKKRPKPKEVQKLVAIDAMWIGGRRVSGRRCRWWMGCRCGPRAGVHGLITFVPGKLDGWGAAVAAAHRRARRDRGPSGEADGILPWDKVDTPNGPVPCAQFCRGGGRAVDNAVLEGLQEFLGRFRNAAAQEDKAEVKGSGKNKGKRGKGDGGKAASSSTPSPSLEANAGNKGKGQGSSVWKGWWHAPSRTPAPCWMTFAGYGSGRAARRHRAKQTAEDHGSVDKQRVKPAQPVLSTSGRR